MNEWIWVMVQALVVLITLPLIYLQVRIQTKGIGVQAEQARLQTEAIRVQTEQVRLQTAAHLVQTLGANHQRWTESAMLRARYSVSSRYLSKDLAFDGVSEYVAEYMEELGGYVRMDAVPVEVIWGAQSWYLEHYYCMLKEGILAMRQRYHDETLYRGAENLFVLMLAHSGQEGAPNAERGPEDLRKFAESEVQMTSAFLGLQATTAPPA